MVTSEKIILVDEHEVMIIEDRKKNKEKVRKRKH